MAAMGRKRTVRFRSVADIGFWQNVRQIAPVTRRMKLAVGAILYEAYWAYEFFSAPVPDEAMQSVGAIFFAVVVPAFAGLLVLAARLLSKWPMR